MFLGEFSHAIDEKNRLVLPAKFRAFINDLEDKKGFFIVASPVSGEHCLRLYTKSGWKPVEQRKRKVTTALKAYAAFATSADRGAVRDLGDL